MSQPYSSVLLKSVLRMPERGDPGVGVNPGATPGGIRVRTGVYPIAGPGRSQQAFRCHQPTNGGQACVTSPVRLSQPAR
jgi:hypothetical protein